MSSAEREQYQRRRADAHGHAAAVHDRAAKLHEQAGKFFEEHDQPGQAERERYLTVLETKRAADDREQAAAAAGS